MVVIRDAANIEEALDKIPELLAPFDENMDYGPTLEPLDDEQIGRAVDYYRSEDGATYCNGEDGPAKPFDQFVTEGNLEAWNEWKRQAIGHYFGSGASDGSYNPETDTFGYMSRYNPKSKWDWYSIGGRWHGFFQVKPNVAVGAEELPSYRLAGGAFGDRVEGTLQIEQYVPGKHVALLGGSGVGGDSEEDNFSGRADVARKGDIDFEGMRTLAGQAAELAYDKFEEVTKGLEPAPRFEDLVTERGKAAGIDPENGHRDNPETWTPFIQGVREEYHAHPWIKALAENDLKGWFSDPRDDYCIDKGGREAFVEAHRAGTTGTFAVLLDGEWHEKGSMGWWGVVSDEKESDEWRAQQDRLLRGLPDDTYLALIDVHI
jgi:hypothetical protein